MRAWMQPQPSDDNDTMMTTTTMMVLWPPSPSIRQKGVDTINSSQLYHHWHTNYDELFSDAFFAFALVRFVFPVECCVCP